MAAWCREGVEVASCSCPTGRLGKPLRLRRRGSHRRPHGGVAAVSHPLPNGGGRVGPGLAIDGMRMPVVKEGIDGLWRTCDSACKLIALFLACQRRMRQRT